MSLGLTSRVDILKDRAWMFKLARQFFDDIGVMEVDVPILSQKGSIDLHIDLIKASCMDVPSFLHSSPEYGMKRLLSEGIGDIYQMSHVFREGERGDRHNPEFVMVEWYRHNFKFEEMMEETIAFLSLFLGDYPVEILTYKELLAPYNSLDEQEEIIFSNYIEPKLGNNKFSVLIDFPIEMAALAKVVEKGGEIVAKRFEIFFQGMELANGYEELIDPIEQRKRFEKSNGDRVSLKKESYPIDTNFLSALEKGVPEVCGVACGFDRLMMLRHKASTIDEVIPFSLERA